MKPDSLAPDRLTQVGSMELTGRGRQQTTKCYATLSNAAQGEGGAVSDQTGEGREMLHSACSLHCW
jgi:hypothetical protein